MSDRPVLLDSAPLGPPPWPTLDPFLFCVHHDDAYPAGNDRLGPAASLTGRQLGQDFAGKDGWRMYHGEVVPGFPAHPHRGFETVTIVRSGYIDHSDSLGATARYGQGDVQWLTAGAGVVHAEMFPLLEPARPNPLELFQIWLNLPAADKMAEPHFTMLWASQIPRLTAHDEAGRATEVALFAGSIGGRRPPPPPPRSWAARVDNDVAIWTIRMQAGAGWTLPAAAGQDSGRALYFFRGASMRVAGQPFASRSVVLVRGDAEVPLEAGDGDCELLLLQGRPIAEPVQAQGPFVMNTRAELERAYADYRRTRFGGWPWPSSEPVHARDAGRFARHPDGRIETSE
jgi:redox-sensitive bicupin YhaK (pirin superfamily)